MTTPRRARLSVPGSPDLGPRTPGPRVRKSPAGYLVFVDRRCLVDAGKEGVIKDRDVADVIRDFLKLANPEADVRAFEVFTLTGS